MVWSLNKVSKGAKIRNRYNQVPHPTQDTNGKVTNSQLDTTKGSPQEVSPFPAGDHKAQINRCTQRHNKHKTEKNINDPQRSTALEWSVKYLSGRPAPVPVDLTLNIYMLGNYKCSCCHLFIIFKVVICL